MSNAATLSVANTILEQLGGPRFMAMTGVKRFSGDVDSLTFKLPRGAKKGINALKIRLDATDTYTVTFYKQSPAPTFRVAVIEEISMIYGDQLRAVFTATTGLETSL